MPRRKKFALAAAAAFVLTLPLFAWEREVAVDLNGNWEFKRDHGKVEKSRFKAENNTLKIDYVFEETSEDSSAHPDYKGRDAFTLTKEGLLDLSGFSAGEFEYTGNGTSHNFALILSDAEGKQAIYKLFTWHDPAQRKYRFTLNSVCDGWPPNPDMSKIVSVGVLVDEGGEARYSVNSGSVAVNGIRFNNFYREENLRRDIALLRRCGGDKKRIDELEKTLNQRAGKLEDLEKLVLQAKYDILVPAGKKFALFKESVWRKVRPEFVNFNGGAEKLDVLKLNAAGNEYESVQFVVVPSPAGVSGVSVRLDGDLVSGGNRISAEDVEIRIPDFVNTTPTNMTYYDYVGPTPDIMSPNRTFSVSGGAVRPVWATIYVKPDTPAGIYRGKLVLSANGENIDIPLELTVRDFTLPETWTVARQFVYWLPAIARFYNFREGSDPCGYNKDGYGIPREMLFEHLDFLLKYPLEIINLGWVFDTDTGEPCWPLSVDKDGNLDFSLFDEIMEFCRARGMRKFAMGDFGRKAGRITDEKYRQNVAKVMKPFIAHQKEKGYFADANFKVLDEPDNPELYKEILAECRFIHDLDPAIPTLAAIGFPDPALAEHVNIWLLRPNNWDEKVVKKLRDAGAEASWYWCICPYARPLPNYFINYPATDPRIIEHLHYRVGAKNFLMWAVNNWNKNIKPSGTPRYPDIAWDPNVFGNFNGDGLFVYPLPGGKLAASMRLEELRDGAEENEYFVLLEKLAGKLEKQNKNADLARQIRQFLKLEHIKAPYDFDASVETLDRVRNQAGDLIEAAQKALEGK